MPDAQSFVGAMFDLSFREFITIRIIKVLYVLLLLGVGLSSLGILISGLVSGEALGIFGGAVASLVAFVVGALVVRVYMELLIVFFRIAENTDSLVKMKSVAGSSN